MYRTVQEMHIALDLALQHINSNRKQSISPYLKDMVLNNAVLQYIDTRSSGKTNDRSGFEETGQRYDELKELKRYTGFIRSGKNTISDKNVFVIQPNDYYRIINIRCNVVYNKLKLQYSYVDHIVNYKTLLFPNDYASGNTYKSFRIFKGVTKIFDINDYHNFPDLIGYNSKFMIVNLVLNKFSNFVWNRWDKLDLEDTFIILDNDTLTNYRIEYISDVNPILNISVNRVLEYKVFNNSQPENFTKNIAPVELISSIYDTDVDSNVHYNRNRHRKPIATLDINRVYIKEGNDFLVTDVDIEYIIKPTLIDHITDKICQITINRAIIDLAVQRLNVYIKNENYQHMAREIAVSE